MLFDERTLRVTGKSDLFIFGEDEGRGPETWIMLDPDNHGAQEDGYVRVKVIDKQHRKGKIIKRLDDTEGYLVCRGEIRIEDGICGKLREMKKVVEKPEQDIFKFQDVLILKNPSRISRLEKNSYLTHLSEYIDHYYFDEKYPEEQWASEKLSRNEGLHYNDKPFRLRSSTISRLGILASEELEGILKRLEAEEESLEEGIKDLQSQTEKKSGELKKLEEDQKRLEKEVKEVSSRTDEQKKLAEKREVEIKQRLEEKDCLEKRVKHLQNLLEESPDESSVEKLETAPDEEEVEAIKRAQEAFQRAGRKISDKQLVALHTALKLTPFTVLSGPSGSGKTSLLRTYAKALGIRQTLIPVQPNWLSVDDLHGFVHPLNQKAFKETPFSQALKQHYIEGLRDSEERSNQPLDLIILDEINLSHVEYFLSSYLSALETDRRVQLVSAEEASELEGSVAWLKETKGRVYLPHTFLITGTANEDHTTKGFSDKFRDRSAFLKVSSPPSLDDLSVDLKHDEVEATVRVTRGNWVKWREDENSIDPSVARELREAFDALFKIDEVKRQFSPRVYFATQKLASQAYSLLKDLDLENPEHNAVDVALSLRFVQKFTVLLTQENDRKNLLEFFEGKKYKWSKEILGGAK